jgi:hypothetical protein
MNRSALVSLVILGVTAAACASDAPMRTELDPDTVARRLCGDAGPVGYRVSAKGDDFFVARRAIGTLQRVEALAEKALDRPLGAIVSRGAIATHGGRCTSQTIFYDHAVVELCVTKGDDGESYIASFEVLPFGPIKSPVIACQALQVGDGQRPVNIVETPNGTFYAYATRACTKSLEAQELTVAGPLTARGPCK